MQGKFETSVVVTSIIADKDGDSSELQNLPVRAYLDKTVVPILLQALAECSKERPQNPIEFVANYLLEHNPERKQWACWRAISRNKMYYFKIIHNRWTSMTDKTERQKSSAFLRLQLRTGMAGWMDLDSSLERLGLSCLSVVGLADL